MGELINFRNLDKLSTNDGKKIKEGMIFRSGSLDDIKKNERKFLESLHIKTIIDLRPEEEQKTRKNKINGASRITIPFDTERITRGRSRPFMHKKNSEQKITKAIESVYGDMVDIIKPLLPELFDILLSPESYPVIINCRAGKDRTGIALAIIQLALDVKVEFIIKDYLKSNIYFLPLLQKRLRIFDKITFGLTPVKNIEIVFTSKEEYITTVIKKINNFYDGIKNYLNICGISSEKILKLNSLLLE